MCLTTEFVAIFPVLRSPACSGCAGSCGFSSLIWFATFVMGSPLRGRGWCGPRSERRFGLLLFPLWADSSRWSHPLGRVCFRSHSRSERRLFCISLGVVQGLHTHPFAPEAPFSVLMPLSFGMRSPSGSGVLVGSHLSMTGGSYLALYPSGWPSSLCLRLLFAPCHCRRVSWWSSLRPRVFRSSWLSPVFFPIR